MFVLGVDPGLTRCGYGIVTRSPDAAIPFKACLAGVIETSPRDDLAVRLGQLASDIDSILDEEHPDVVVVEKIFFQNNVRTAISVAQASGVILASASRRGIAVRQYTPNEVKNAVVGHGGATKIQVQEMIMNLCGLDEIPKPPDVADALALAICSLTSARLDAAIAAVKS
jgi:crossover junction endodeoxyribonuclease RuvC